MYTYICIFLGLLIFILWKTIDKCIFLTNNNEIIVFFHVLDYSGPLFRVTGVCPVQFWKLFNITNLITVDNKISRILPNIIGIKIANSAFWVIGPGAKPWFIRSRKIIVFSEALRVSLYLIQSVGRTRFTTKHRLLPVQYWSHTHTHKPPKQRSNAQTHTQPTELGEKVEKQE